MKKFFKVLGIIILIPVVIAVLFIGYLTVTEFRPDPVEQVELVNNGANALAKDSFTVLTLNVGYCALGEESDFFMDGGTEVRPDNEHTVYKNYRGLADLLLKTNADFTMLQEVDSNSKRSYGLDQVAGFRETLRQGTAYALNYSCNYVPFPWPPIGRVHSGLLTLTDYRVREASRVSLPCPFSWPVSAANLKRCLLVSRMPIEGSDKELVLVNLHLEAYDDGEGKLAQTQQLLSLLRDEYQKGNYVIAGGDFNQSFPGAEDAYPNTHTEQYLPGELKEADLDEGWRYAWDDTHPTCRLLNQPYDPADTAGTQYYVIDGFLVSPNLEIVSTETMDEDFACTDHNPVLLTVRLR